MIDYIEEFPIKGVNIPQRLKQLLSPVSLTAPKEMVEVTARYEHDPYGGNREYYHMTMVTIPETKTVALRDYDSCSCNGVAALSTSVCDTKGYLATLPYLPRENHIVASWGTGSFYSFYLAQDVWMTLGLTPRCVGGDEQRVIFDDLSVPIVAIAEGEISSSYYYQSNRNVHWRMRNDYIRKYLWQRGHIGVRIFYYEGYVEQTAAYEQAISHNGFYSDIPEPGWYELRLQKTDKGILLQFHGAVIALLPERCKSDDIYSLVWPGDTEPMTKFRARRLSGDTLYLRDSFLTKYEKNSVYSSTPYKYCDAFICSPSYLGQWSFTECIRIGRNLIMVPVRELYKPKPNEEIMHAYSHAISKEEAKQFDFEQEHIVSKAYRLVDQLLDFGNNLHRFAGMINATQYQQEEYTGFSTEKIQYSHWNHYPILAKLAQVIPLDMNEQDFLARCKTLNEIIGRIKSGPLKKILNVGGCPNDKINNWQGLKLIQALANLIDDLTNNAENAEAFIGCAANIDWIQRNKIMAPLFIVNDLRNADAHEIITECITRLEEIGFDHANLRDGHGLAFDYILDKVIESLYILNNKINEIITN